VPHVLNIAAEKPIHRQRELPVVHHLIGYLEGIGLVRLRNWNCAQTFSSNNYKTSYQQCKNEKINLSE